MKIKNLSIVNIGITPVRILNSALVEFKPQMNNAEHKDIQHQQTLERKLNYLNTPGFHSRQSPVVGTRSEELTDIITAMNLPDYYVLHNFEKAIYQSRYLYIIPNHQRDAANKFARQIFLDYIEKYKTYGVTEENCVSWKKSGYPGEESNKTWLSDLENEFNTWRLHVAVEADNGIHNEKYDGFLPPHVVAYHELMHLEEAPKGAPESYQYKPGGEILTATKTIILLDQIYKMINGLRIDDVVDYKLELDIVGKKIALGEFANFYRKLEAQYQNLAKAILSPESLSHLPKVNCITVTQKSLFEMIGGEKSYGRLAEEIDDEELHRIDRLELIISSLGNTKTTLSDDNLCVSVIPFSIFGPSLKEFQSELDVAKLAGNHQAQKIWDQNWGLVVRR